MRRFLRHLHCAVLLGLICGLPTPAMAVSPVPLPCATGYRLSHCHRPTPANAEPARTLDSAARQRLLHEQPQALP